MTPETEQSFSSLSLELQASIEQTRFEIGNLQFAISQDQEAIDAQYAALNQRQAALEDAKRRLLRLEGGLTALNLMRQKLADVPPVPVQDDSQGG